MKTTYVMYNDSTCCTHTDWYVRVGTEDGGGGAFRHTIAHTYIQPYIQLITHIDTQTSTNIILLTYPNHSSLSLSPCIQHPHHTTTAVRYMPHPRCHHHPHHYHGHLEPGQILHQYSGGVCTMTLTTPAQCEHIHNKVFVMCNINWILLFLSFGFCYYHSILDHLEF